jgi:16S rRNA (cytosine967-C5)-methyltransferase
MWLTEYPKPDAARFLKAQARPPAVGLAVDTARLGPEPALALSRRLGAHPACIGRQGLGLAFAPGASLAALAGDLGLTPEEVAAVYRQGFAARQALGALAPERWKAPVWDACAGRGGKTRLILEAGGFSPDAPVLASDTHKGRLAALARELAPHVEAGRLLAFRARAEAPPLGVRPRTILLDAPCTGLGTLSRRPDIKWKRTPEDAGRLVRTQAAMLRQAFVLLQPGGSLYYLTCTMNPEENQRQVAALLAAEGAARLAGTWSTGPQAQAGEFFFAATIHKAG